MKAYEVHDKNGKLIQIYIYDPSDVLAEGYTCKQVQIASQDDVVISREVYEEISELVELECGLDDLREDEINPKYVAFLQAAKPNEEKDK